MKIADQRISSCRHCQFYTLEGRRGGHCNRLGTSVQGHWSACSLGISPFAPDWKSLTDSLLWQPISHARELTPSEVMSGSKLEQIPIPATEPEADDERVRLSLDYTPLV